MIRSTLWALVELAVGTAFFAVLGLCATGCAVGRYHPYAERLVVRATGEDLGEWVEGTVAVDNALGYRIDFARSIDVYVEQNAFNCYLGDGVILTSDRPHEDAFVTADGNVVQVDRGDQNHDVVFTAGLVLTATPYGSSCNHLREPAQVAGDYYHWVEDDNGAVLRTIYQPDALVVKR